MEVNFKNKNILITGGSRGIGLEISNLFRSLSGNVCTLNSSLCNFENEECQKVLMNNTDRNKLLNGEYAKGKKQYYESSEKC